MLINLPKTYSPKDFEKKQYEYWLENNYFKSEINNSKEPFTIIMPPPNVTGDLHMGHALGGTIQDLLIRYKRMQGYEVLWQPGLDHASISTEARVVAKITSEGKSKESLGREGFLKEAWDWTHKYGGNIRNQYMELGASCDWERERFTLDDEMSEAVTEVFIRLYKKDLIYRGNRIINWCPDCGTAISDIEIEHEESKGKIWYVKYPIKNSNKFITVATTRPETILGDLAVAVNPEDKRYKKFIGQKVILPFVDREIPIIEDEYVEMDFGTGAVKVTPSHDPNDFEMGERANLGQCLIMNKSAKMNENAGVYEGLDRFEARKKIVKDLDDLGLLVSVKDHENSVGHCERCNTIVEPIISKQWFVKMKPLAKPALEAYETGEFNIIPERFGKIYTNWMENIQDWCISRQLWWGHRLPVYYCDDCEEIHVSKEKPEKCKNCSSSNLSQDKDTLDTWFSSALWPFSTLGWPNKTEELNYFFPTDVLVTGYDIIFFWVARMIFSSIEQMGKVPFKDVMLTGMVLDAEGRKMSKSLDNGIDPLDIIHEYGADALRFMLVTGNSPGNDMRFREERVESSRNFANKIWNATRFVLMNLDEKISTENFNIENLEEEDKWILSKLNRTIDEVTSNLESYEIGLAANNIYNFVWEDYCDWYIEVVKSRLYSGEGESNAKAQQVLLYVLKDICRLLHPFMPFITEEIWSYLPDNESALIVAEWPKYKEEFNLEESEKNFEYIKDAIKRIRNIRSEMNVIPSRKSDIIFYTKDKSIKKIVSNGTRYFKDLASADNVYTIEDNKKLGNNNVSVVLDKAEVFLPLSDLIDFKKELERLEKEEIELIEEIKRAEGMLSNKGFVSNAPKKVVEEERDKLSKYKDMLDNLLETMDNLKKNI